MYSSMQCRKKVEREKIFDLSGDREADPNYLTDIKYSMLSYSCTLLSLYYNLREYFYL